MNPLIRYYSSLSIIVFSLFIFSFAQAELKERAFYRVSHVIDGDTIKFDNGEHVRLIGIDTPELKYNAKFQRDLKERHLTKSAELSMARQSYKFTQRLVEGKKVHLKFDKVKYDEYHRTLAYVFLSNGIFVNAEIVKEGYAYEYSVKPDLKYMLLFRHLYHEAREHKRGLWKVETIKQKHFKWFRS